MTRESSVILSFNLGQVQAGTSDWAAMKSRFKVIDDFVAISE